MEHIKSHNYFFERSLGLSEGWVDRPKEIPQEMNDSYKQEEHGPGFPIVFRSTITEEFAKFLENFREWMRRTPKDEEYLSTPLPEALRNLFNVQQEYLQLIEIFASLYPNHITPEQLAVWNQEVTAAFNGLVLDYTSEYIQATQKTADPLSEPVAEISVPLIMLSRNSGLLLLAGGISAHEGQSIYDNTLLQCGEARLEKLVIDLSSVPKMDITAAQQLFLLIESLYFLGVQTTLVGIRPAIAKLFIQLHLDVNKVDIFPTLMQAMKNRSLM